MKLTLSDIYFTHNNNGRWHFLKYGIANSRTSIKRVSARRFHKLYHLCRGYVIEYAPGSKYDFVLYHSDVFKL